MKKYPLLILLVFHLHLSYGQVNNAAPISPESREKAEALIIKAGYAFRYNDHLEALKLYQEAKALDPENPVIDILMNAAMQKQKEESEENSASFKITEGIAIGLLEEEGNKFMNKKTPAGLGKSEMKQMEERLNFYSDVHYYLILATTFDCEAITKSLDLYTKNNAEVYEFDFRNEIQNAVIFLGEKHCRGEIIYSRKYKNLGDEVSDKRQKLDYYVTAVNYDPTYTLAFDELEKMAMKGSYKQFVTTFKNNGSISTQGNPVLDDYKIYHSSHPEVIRMLQDTDRAKLKKARNLPWKVFAGTLTAGAVGVALVSFDATKVVFMEEKDGKMQLTETGRVFDTGGWGLVFASIPAALVTIPITKKKRTYHKDRIHYLNMYLE